MKSTILTLALFIAGISAMAQRSPYVFPEFVKASVLQKGGGVTEATMNYNMLTQEMMFMQGNDKTVLDMANVDTVYLQDKKFIPAGGAIYYQKLTDTKIPLYVQNFNKKVSAAGKAEFDKSANANSGMTASQGFKKASNETLTDYDLQLSDTFVLQSESVFWLQKGKSFVKANDKKSILKVFPDKEQAFDAFVKDNSPDLKKPADMAKLISFLNK